MREPSGWISAPDFLGIVHLVLACPGELDGVGVASVGDLAGNAADGELAGAVILEEVVGGLHHVATVVKLHILTMHHLPSTSCRSYEGLGQADEIVDRKRQGEDSLDPDVTSELYPRQKAARLAKPKISSLRLRLADRVAACARGAAIGGAGARLARLGGRAKMAVDGHMRGDATRLNLPMKLHTSWALSAPSVIRRRGLRSSLAKVASRSAKPVAWVTRPSTRCRFQEGCSHAARV